MTLDRQELFAAKVDELVRLVGSRDQLSPIHAAGILRLLLIDGGRLIDQVRRNRPTRVRFMIREISHPPVAGAWFKGNILDPLQFTGSGVQLSLKEFLKVEVIGLESGETLDIGELIKFAAHVMGAVHAGEPHAGAEEALIQLRARFPALTDTMVLGTLRIVARIATRTLLGLRHDLLDLDRFDSKPGGTLFIGLRIVHHDSEGDTEIANIGGVENSLRVYVRDGYLVARLRAGRARIEVRGPFLTPGRLLPIVVESSAHGGQLLLRATVDDLWSACIARSGSENWFDFLKKPLGIEFGSSKYGSWEFSHAGLCSTAMSASDRANFLVYVRNRGKEPERRLQMVPGRGLRTKDSADPEKPNGHAVVSKAQESSGPKTDTKGDRPRKRRSKR